MHTEVNALITFTDASRYELTLWVYRECAIRLFRMQWQYSSVDMETNKSIARQFISFCLSHQAAAHFKHNLNKECNCQRKMLI